MHYDWNKPLISGTVVCSNYNLFDGTTKQGVFLVLYDEQMDINVLDKKNVVAIKISTQDTCVANYSVELNNNMNPFFDKPCIACCSKIHILHKKEQVYKVIGNLDMSTYKKVYKVYNKFLSELNRQVIDSL